MFLKLNRMDARFDLKRDETPKEFRDADGGE